MNDERSRCPNSPSISPYVTNNVVHAKRQCKSHPRYCKRIQQEHHTRVNVTIYPFLVSKVSTAGPWSRTNAPSSTSIVVAVCYWAATLATTHNCWWRQQQMCTRRSSIICHRHILLLHSPQGFRELKNCSTLFEFACTWSASSFRILTCYIILVISHTSFVCIFNFFNVIKRRRRALLTKEGRI